MIVYDPADRQSWQVNPLGQRTTFAYDAAGRTTELQLGNDARTKYAYLCPCQPAGADIFLCRGVGGRLCPGLFLAV